MKVTANTSLRRKLAALFCVPSAAAMAAAGAIAVVLVNGPMVQPAYADAVPNCLSLSDGRLVNNCSFTVEAVWCTENIDCRNGNYTNMATIRAGGYVYPQGGRSGNTVNWGACEGANTIHINGTRPYSYEYYCD